MHSYVIPKNYHNIIVAEQLYFQFFMAKNKKLNVQKCQRFTERSWITICTTPEVWFQLWLWLWLWLLLSNIYFSKSRYVGQWKLHDRFDLTWESLKLCKKAHQRNEMNEWMNEGKLLFLLFSCQIKKYSVPALKHDLWYISYSVDTLQKKWYTLNKWGFFPFKCNLD